MTPPGDSYLDRIATAVADGEQFAGLYATSDRQLVRSVWIAADGTPRPESIAVVDGSVPSIVGLVPAAGWDEREAHDSYRIEFDGHQPVRPLIDHDAPLERWTVPVRGQGTYQVAVGPIHAGVIESGHFRFHVVGDRILHVDAQLFYKHRGLEKAAEGLSLPDGMAFVSRACAGCSVANALAYAHACEQVSGQRPPDELRRVRTILAELERVWNHLNDIAAICAGVGLAAGTTTFAALTERARRLNAALTEHRFLSGAVHVGHSPLEWTSDTVRATATELAALRSAATRGWRELAFNTSFQDRLLDVGVLNPAGASRLGVVGPAARAAGLAIDARTHANRLSYGGFLPVSPDQATGDVRSRFEQRGLELWQSLTILDQLLDRPVVPSRATGETDPQPIAVGIVESPRGRTTCAVEAVDGRVSRLHLRTGSYANWPAVTAAAAGTLLPDFPLINKSFELCYACVDR
ncbi:MAG: hydrogenase large subunit [Mycobacteriales bacterium]